MPARAEAAKFLQQKLGTDIAWTMGSLVVLAGSGIVINILIVGLRDAAALGVFNLAYAIYVVASQLGAFGLHYSTMRHAALYESKPLERWAMLFTAAICALVLGGITASVVYLSAPLLGLVFTSPSTGSAIEYASLGLLLFPLNKVLLGYLNGLRTMKVFALLQSGRYAIVMLWVAMISASDLPFELTTLGFAVSELTTSAAATAYMRARGLLMAPKLDRVWVRRHFIFGGKIVASGMFVELNSRIDVLLLGFFVSERSVGIYSFAAMLVDGLYHVLVMVRINFNPVLVAAVRDKDWKGAQRLLRQSKRFFFPATAALALYVIATFCFLAVFIVPNKGLLDGLQALVILLVGLTIVSAFVPFDNLLVASGHPAYQTVQHLTVVFSNIGLNVTLVPILGLEGVAIASAVSYIAGIFVLVLLVQRLLSWNLLTNSVGS